MAIYAAMIDSMDQAIGHILKAVADLETENTMVLFLADNGGCDESGLYGFERKKGGKLGTDSSFASYGLCWANASNTPFQFFKKDNHEGGIASPLIVHWPEGIEKEAHGKLRHEPTHVIDIMATAVQLAGAEYPARFRGHDILPLEGLTCCPPLKTNRSTEPRCIGNTWGIAPCARVIGGSWPTPFPKAGMGALQSAHRSDRDGEPLQST